MSGIKMTLRLNIINSSTAVLREYNSGYSPTGAYVINGRFIKPFTQQIVH